MKVLNFWNRVDAVRGINNSLKSVAEKAGLNYEVIKVQHSLGRMPRAEEATKIAQALQVPTQWLVLGKCENVIDELRIGKSNENEKMLHLLELIVKFSRPNSSSDRKFLNQRKSTIEQRGVTVIPLFTYIIN